MIFVKYIYILTDYPWVDLQCTEAVHGDEPEAFRRMHPAIQGRMINDHRVGPTKYLITLREGGEVEGEGEGESARRRLEEGRGER